MPDARPAMLFVMAVGFRWMRGAPDDRGGAVIGCFGAYFIGMLFDNGFDECVVETIAAAQDHGMIILRR